MNVRRSAVHVVYMRYFDNQETCMENIDLFTNTLSIAWQPIDIQSLSFESL